MVQLLAAAANAAPATVSLAGVAPSRPTAAMAWLLAEPEAQAGRSASSI